MGGYEQVRFFVNGQGMSGGSLNGPLQAVPFLGPATSAPKYRFFAVRDEFPAMLPVPDGGHPVEGELYLTDLPLLRDVFLPAEPPELELGIIELDDGSGAFAMKLRPELAALPDLTGRYHEISALGSWRRYRDA